MTAEAAQEWALSEAQRAETVARMAKNIGSLAFFRGAPIADDVAAAAAAAVEKKAYTVARVEARTTTGVRWVLAGAEVGAGGAGGCCCRLNPAGHKRPPAAAARRASALRRSASRRPHHETLKAYIRKLSALALEVVQSGGALEAAGGAPTAQGEVRRARWRRPFGAVPLRAQAGAVPPRRDAPSINHASVSIIGCVPCAGAGPVWRLARLSDQGERRGAAGAPAGPRSQVHKGRSTVAACGGG